MICNEVKRIISAIFLVVFMVTTLSINVTAADPQIEESEGPNMFCSSDNSEEEETNSQRDGSEQCGDSDIISSDLSDSSEEDEAYSEEKDTAFLKDGSGKCKDSSIRLGDLFYESEEDEVYSDEDESGLVTDQYENLEYSFNKATGELTISARNMDFETCIVSYPMGEKPWGKYISEIKTIIIKDGITKICGGAFMGCESLTSVTIPGSVVYIEGNAFACCKKLTKVTYLGVDEPRMVNTVSKPARGLVGLFEIFSSRDCMFEGRGSTFYLTPLKTVIVSPYYNGNYFYDIKVRKEESAIPDKILGDCGEGAKYEFDTCAGELIISGTGAMPNYSYWHNDVLDNSPWDLFKYRIKSVIIKDGVTKIGTGAFYNCKNLTSVTIPNSIIEIDSFAFSGCESLTSVTISDNVDYIGESAFYGCTSLTSATISSKVRFIGHHAFACCDNLKTVNYYGTTKPTVGRYMVRHPVFIKCPNLKKVNVTNDYKEKSFCGVKVEKI